MECRRPHVADFRIMKSTQGALQGSPAEQERVRGWAQGGARSYGPTCGRSPCCTSTASLTSCGSPRARLPTWSTLARLWPPLLAHLLSNHIPMTYLQTYDQVSMLLHMVLPLGSSVPFLDIKHAAHVCCKL